MILSNFVVILRNFVVIFWLNPSGNTNYSSLNHEICDVKFC